MSLATIIAHENKIYSPVLVDQLNSFVGAIMGVTVVDHNVETICTNSNLW